MSRSQWEEMRARMIETGEAKIIDPDREFYMFPPSRLDEDGEAYIRPCFDNLRFVEKEKPDEA